MLTVINGEYNLSTDNVITTADSLIGSRTITSLPPGATNKGTTMVTLPSTQASGGYSVDANNNQIENDETNNSLYLGTPVSVCSPTKICVQ